MFTLEQINNQILLKELDECLTECRISNVLVSIIQFQMTKEGELSENTIEMELFSDTTCVIDIDDKNSIFTLFLKRDDVLDYGKIRGMCQTVRERNTKRFLNNENGDYTLSIELVKEKIEESTVCHISFLFPLWISEDDGRLMVVFSSKNVHFGVDKIDYVAVNDEVDYAEEVERHALGRENDGKDDFDEQNDIISNGDYIG